MSYSVSIKQSAMETHDKLLRRILEGRSDANIDFSDLRALLLHFAFEERVRVVITFFGVMVLKNESISKNKAAKPSLIKYAKSAQLSYIAAWEK
ncbi:hypothetical protein [Nitrosomonas sp. sh817]|uniref:hypothetical protein n=1 Tax=Nitrosomonas sp. sh817 TaxID=3070658 RepID=UPI0027DC1B60|nr:hypothetical protein [Nitrosomonas sp. sh817]WMJ09166.1 hypothetical protein RBH92_02905 [Nitrosomonas sp. sh817]